MVHLGESDNKGDQHSKARHARIATTAGGAAAAAAAAAALTKLNRRAQRALLQIVNA